MNLVQNFILFFFLIFSLVLEVLGIDDILFWRKWAMVDKLMNKSVVLLSSKKFTVTASWFNVYQTLEKLILKAS